VTAPFETRRLASLLRSAAPDVGASRLRDLAVATAAAVAGGTAILPYYVGSRGVGEPHAPVDRRRLEVEHKAPGDPVTAADHASNRAILGLLATECPDDPVLSEESEPPPEAGRAHRLWVVDPLDGTREFIDGLGEFAAMVGLADGGRCVLGAVYRPDPGILDLGLADGGAWRARVRVRSSGSAPGEGDAESSDGGSGDTLPELLLEPLRVPVRRDGPVRLIHSRSHRPEALDELEATLGTLESVPSGSVGVKCGLIASGEADLYVHPVPYLKEWDTCAPEAVLRGAGGRVTDCLGERLAYGKSPPVQPEGILAAEPEVWSRVLPIVRHIAPGA
jgi:3'(2'), 5'-bisphosphate nucleotidase